MRVVFASSLVPLLTTSLPLFKKKKKKPYWKHRAPDPNCQSSPLLSTYTASSRCPILFRHPVPSQGQESMPSHLHPVLTHTVLGWREPGPKCRHGPGLPLHKHCHRSKPTRHSWQLRERQKAAQEPGIASPEPSPAPQASHCGLCRARSIDGAPTGDRQGIHFQYYLKATVSCQSQLSTRYREPVGSREAVKPRSP